VLVCAVLAACSEPPAALSLIAGADDAPAGADSGEPFLYSDGDTVLMSWLERSGTGARRLLLSRYVGGEWSVPRAIAERDRFLVNVADFPSVVRGDDGTLWAHWLERDPEGFGYGVRVVSSVDDGASWSDPWTPHEDGTPTEHGFVTLVPRDGGVGILWLDGRAFAGVRGGGPVAETALFYRRADVADDYGDESELDSRVCDCCQLDAATTAEGTVVVYRDRSPEEIRDIRVLRYDEGSWIDGGLVHADGWETGACPINGPAVAAANRTVAVAWFTAADGQARVQVAFSQDGGRSFAPPTRVDDGAPAGRVDVVLLADGSALVSWVERTGGDGAAARLRRVGPHGRLLETLDATSAFTERVTGFPRLAPAGEGAILLAWTDGAEVTPRVRVTRIDLEAS
jgi:hypothetical protein